jgi:hypothetical protein
VTSLLLLGFLIGMRHALEADHIAAVATLSSRAETLSDALRQAIAWGSGHTITLFVFCSMAVLMDTMIPEQLAIKLEFAVGLMLVVLGCDVLWRLYRERIHFHSHRHSGGVRHFHAHAHAGRAPHHPARHAHTHDFPLRALSVGLMHGMAGSAALIVLTLEATVSPAFALIYIVVFGCGSLLGMVVLSIVIAIPLRRSAQGFTWFHNGLQSAVGLSTIVLGAYLAMGSGTRIAFV